ncbi:MAG: DUF2782 domain-containing protein [Gammaproteobacteria bacterium]
MQRFIFSSLMLVSAFWTAVAAAQDPDRPEAVPEVPEPPLPVQSGEQLEPDITIIRKGGETIQEYRQNGSLYMIKVVPDIGPPYYFIDYDGDGNLDVRRSDVEAGMRINQWKIFSWK